MIKRIFKEAKGLWTLSFVSLLLFALLIIVLGWVDVRPIGPLGSEVGLATLNQAFAEALGYSEMWYSFSEPTLWAAIVVVLGFGCLGAVQLLRRKKLMRVDRDLYALGALYLLTVIIYLLFEIIAVNYRPLLLDEGLEASFPSTHVFVVMTVMLSAAEQILRRVKINSVRICLFALSLGLTLFAAVGRMLSGVHWFTDILGALLLSVCLVTAYIAAVRTTANNRTE